MEKKEVKKKVSVKIIIKIIALLQIVFFFIPLFTVSCSGETIGFSAARLTKGYSYYGDKVVGPKILCSLLILLPIAVILASFYIKKKEQYNLVVGLSGLINTILLFIIISRGKVVAKEKFVGFETNIAFYISVTLNLVLVAIAVCEFLGYTNKVPILESGEWGDITPRTCKQCGADLKPTYAFCGDCGTEYEEDDHSEEDDNEMLENAFCTDCGNEVEAGEAFCPKCGHEVGL